MPTHCAALLGVRADSSQFGEQEDGQESSLLGRARGAERTAPCACLDPGASESRRRQRASGDELLAAACLRSLAPSHRGPGSHTICHLAPPAVSHAWPQPARDKMVSSKWKAFWSHTHIQCKTAYNKPSPRLRKTGKAHLLGKGAASEDLPEQCCEAQRAGPACSLCLWEEKGSIYHLPCRAWAAVQALCDPFPHLHNVVL